MRFVLTINCDNEAFSGSPHIEIARLLRTAASRAENLEADSGKLIDFNGNSVGSWQLEGERPLEFDFGWSELCEEDPEEEGWCAYHSSLCTAEGPGQ